MKPPDDIFTNKIARYPIYYKNQKNYFDNVIFNMELRSMVNDIFHMDYSLSSRIVLPQNVETIAVRNLSASIESTLECVDTKYNMNRTDLNKTVEDYIFGTLNTTAQNAKIVCNILNLYFSDISPIPLNLNKLLNMHLSLTRGTKTSGSAGILRKKTYTYTIDDNEILKTALPADIEYEMNKLIRSFNTAPFDPITSVSLFCHYFNVIKPFEVCSELFSRTLMHILIAPMGLPWSAYCNLEKYMLDPNFDYISIADDAMYSKNYTEFIEHIINSFHTAYYNLYSDPIMKSIVLDPESYIIIKNSYNVPYFSISDACNWCKSKKQTVRARIKDLIGMGLIEKTGNTCASLFNRTVPFSNARHNAYLLQ